MDWIQSIIAQNPSFGLNNLPYGVFSQKSGSTHKGLGVRLGNSVIDVGKVARVSGYAHQEELSAQTLNRLLGLGVESWSNIWIWLRESLEDPGREDVLRQACSSLEDVDLHLPLKVMDYVDFYASEDHASNVGRIFRPESEALTPNWKHLPIGYHGRSGTIYPSDTPIRRPHGQYIEAGRSEPSFGACQRLDIESELAFIVGGQSRPGDSLDIEQAWEHIFGVALFNDWSARDIQAWEYVPLGPFLGKSFASTISCWITPVQALQSAWCPLPMQDPRPLPYLAENRDRAGLDLQMEVWLNGVMISDPNYRSIYWSAAQMLTHMTVNGATIRPGDVFASGTVSDNSRGAFGSLLELTENGRAPIDLGASGFRGFLQDGDTVTLRGSFAGDNGQPLALGEARGLIVG